MPSVEDLLYPLLKSYMSSPRWVMNLVGRVYAHVPKQVRYGRNYEAFRAELEIKKDELLEKAVDEKLRHTLMAAVDHVPYYAGLKELSGNPLPVRELLKEFPVIDKTIVKENLDKLLSASLPGSARLEGFTGGSTAQPMRFFLQKHVTRSKEYAYIDAFNSRAGIGESDIILALRGRTVPNAGKAGSLLWLYEPIKRHFVLSSDHIAPEYADQYLAAMRMWRPTFIQAFPSAIAQLARLLKGREAGDITKNIRCIQLTSENVYDHQYSLLREVFDCPILVHYGHSERVLMASTLADDDQYYFWPLYGYPEIVDHRGEPIREPNVLGELVGTSFDNMVMPLIRYRTGDFAMWGESRHPDYSGWPVVRRIEGRLQEFLVCRDLRVVSVCAIGAAHLTALSSVAEIQYEQHEIGRVVLNVVAENRLHREQKEEIRRSIAHKTQGGLDVEVREVDAIERTARGKLKMVRQMLDVNRYLAGQGARNA